MNDEIEDRDKRLSGKGMNGRAPQSDVDGTHVISAVKTIKLVLKSTETECAILRPRSAVQRLPVTE